MICSSGIPSLLRSVVTKTIPQSKSLNATRPKRILNIVIIQYLRFSMMSCQEIVTLVRCGLLELVRILVVVAAAKLLLLHVSYKP